MLRALTFFGIGPVGTGLSSVWPPVAGRGVPSGTGASGLYSAERTCGLCHTVADGRTGFFEALLFRTLQAQ